jgi:inorganic pyrophosphatase
MNLAMIPAGREPPNDINVVVEIPQGGPIKYELDHASGALFVDRFLGTAMVYPGNYGFVPQTLAADGDPLDVLIIGPGPVLPGAVVPCRPIGALLMEDEQGHDDKIIAAPLGSASLAELPPAIRDQIVHFFEHYKDLEPGKWVKIGGWADAAEAARLIRAALARAAAAGAR